MRKLFATVLITSTVLITPFALAEADHHQTQDRPGMHSQGHAQQGMMGNDQMQGHMSQMTDTMHRFQNTSDPDERRELLKQHRQQMDQVMGSMCASFNSRKGSEAGHGDTGMEMGHGMRQETMRGDMEMMRSVMSQMEAHMEAQQAMQNQ